MFIMAAILTTVRILIIFDNAQKISKNNSEPIEHLLNLEISFHDLAKFLSEKKFQSELNYFGWRIQ